MPFALYPLKAVYWELGTLDMYGQPTLNTPVELSVRWEHGLAQEILPQTNPQSVDATVWVKQDVTVGSMMWIGALTDLPTPVTDVLEIVEFQKIPDIKGRAYERAALLRRYANSLPTVS